MRGRVGRRDVVKKMRFPLTEWEKRHRVRNDPEPSGKLAVDGAEWDRRRVLAPRAASPSVRVRDDASVADRRARRRREITPRQQRRARKAARRAS